MYSVHLYSFNLLKSMMYVMLLIKSELSKVGFNLKSSLSHNLKSPHTGVKTFQETYKIMIVVGIPDANKKVSFILESSVHIDSSVK